MYKKMLIIAAIFAALSVILGAIAAHFLEQYLTDKMLKVFETAARYQMYHSLAIALCGILFYNNSIKAFKIAFYLFIVGIVLFSGSLYALSLLSLQQKISLHFVGAITPIGGICFIMGWAFIAMGVNKMK